MTGSDANDRVTIGGVSVRGIDVDPETRCAHYATERDVVAIRFACCGEYYPCVECHDAVVDHDREVWPTGSADEPAVRCGACGNELTVSAYLGCEDECPACGAAFNPGCRNHYHYYFADDLVASIEEN